MKIERIINCKTYGVANEQEVRILAELAYAALTGEKDSNMQETISGYRATYIKTRAFLDTIRDEYLKQNITIEEMYRLALAIEQHAASLGPVAVKPDYVRDSLLCGTVSKPEPLRD